MLRRHILIGIGKHIEYYGEAHLHQGQISRDAYLILGEHT
jgi:hypothetical protein